MKTVLSDRIDAMLERKSMLKHPFYQAWNDGKLTRDMLRDYACQYYHFVKDFPRMVSAVHSNTPDISLRQELLRNLMDEEQGAENHPALWMRFANAMGASDRQVAGTMPLPCTRALVEAMTDACRNGSFQEGMAALYAYEAQIPEVSRVKTRGLKQFYGITNPDAVRFFTVHEEADVIHSRQERAMIEVHTPARLEQAVEKAAERTADALWGFLDGVYEAGVGGNITPC
jgi:pyrroloquinoline-quinone synthase